MTSKRITPPPPISIVQYSAAQDDKHELFINSQIIINSERLLRGFLSQAYTYGVCTCRLSAVRLTQSTVIYAFKNVLNYSEFTHIDSVMQ
jgi:hypothetical protein